MLEWVLDRLPAEVDRVIVAVNWQADRLRAYFDGREGDLECIVVEETEPLGTAGAVKNCEAHIQSERFLVLNADIVSDMDLEGMVAQHGSTDAIGTISLKEVPEADVVNYGVVALDPDDPRRITGFVEKPKDPKDAPSRLINAGAYLLERRVLELIPPGQLVSMEKEVFPQLLQDGFYGHAFDGDWIDVGDPARLLAASESLDPNSWHGKDAAVAPDARVQHSVAGDRITVGAGATVQDCVFGDDVVVAPGVTLSHCVVGDGEHVTADASSTRIWSKALPAGYPDKQIGNAL